MEAGLGVPAGPGHYEAAHVDVEPATGLAILGRLLFSAFRKGVPFPMFFGGKHREAFKKGRI